MKDKQHQTPLFSKLCTYIAQNPLPFHIPGHKKGIGMDPEFRQLIGHHALSMDLINIPPLDNLHQPKGVIAEAQTLAAEAFGADHTFFSVQGTTGSILTMILSMCHPGDKLILPRNIHQSVVSALILSGVDPLFLPSNTTSYLDLVDVPNVPQVAQILKEHPDSKAIFLVHPTYFGVPTDLTAIVNLAHQYEMPVLVDEAHGVLNYFHENFPISAMRAGADIAATSLHKAGGSLTQTSMLHVQGKWIDTKQIQTMISMLTTTSTSYLLLASLDTARRNLALHGQQLAEQVFILAKEVQSKIEQIPGLHSLEHPQQDISKLVIQVNELTINGFEAANWLREKHQIEVEFSDEHHIICMITIGDTPQTISRLLQGLQDLANVFYQKDTAQESVTLNLALPELLLTPREAFYHRKRPMIFHEAAGQISAQTIMSYPPGVPILIPGEKITHQHIAYINSLLIKGQSIQGFNNQDKTIQIIDN